MNIIAYEPVAREICLDREREAARLAQANQLPRQSSNTATRHGVIAALTAMLPTLLVFHRGS